MGAAESADSVEKWRRLVLSFPNASYSGNPFELEIDATFTHTSSNTVITLPGYYAGNNTWKVGFMPTRVGEWTYTTTSPDPQLNGVTGSITAVASGHPGMLQGDPSDPRKWKYTDGGYVVPIGLRLDLFNESSSTTEFLAAADFLQQQVKGQLYEGTLRNSVFSDWQAHEFDLVRWDRLESRMEALTQRGLGFHLMLYTDDAGKPPWDGQSATERLLIRYAVARLAGYPVVWFNTGIDIAEYRTDPAWYDWFGSQIKSLDPYDHPVSSRHGLSASQHEMSVQTFSSEADVVAKINDMINHFQTNAVPVSMDDAWGENRPSHPAKDFRPADIRRAFWKGVVAGGVGGLIRGSNYWFAINAGYNAGSGWPTSQQAVQQDLESEQWLRLVNPFIQDKLDDTFATMVPSPTLVDGSGGKYALADPAGTKILYFLMGQNDRWDSGDGGPVTISLTGLSGSYQALWFDPRTGAETRIAPLSGGSNHQLTPPTTDDWLLLLNASLTPTANLSINKVDTQNQVSVGDPVNYTVTVTNNGPDTAQSVVMTDTLPVGATFVSASTALGDCPESGGIVTCDMGNLASGSSIAAAVRITHGVAATITNNVSVTSATPDPDTSNNTASEVTNIVSGPTPDADLGVSITDTPDPVLVGNNVTYTVTITNKGPDTATGIILTNTLPAGTTLVSADPTQGTCLSPGPGLLFCTVNELASTASINITIVVATTSVGTISNESVVTTSVNDPVSNNNGDTESTSVIAANSPPAAIPQSAFTFRDVPLDITLSGTDPDDCQLTFSIDSGPSSGSLAPIIHHSCVPGSPNTDSAEITYTPNPGFTGPDSFTFKVGDGASSSNAATIDINVADSPVFGVDLEGRPQPPHSSWVKNFVVKLYSPDANLNANPPPAPLFSFQTATDENGRLTFAPVPGIYILHIKGDGTLATVLSGLDLSAPPTGVIDLGLQKAGDYNGDNVADSTDYSRLLNVFGKLVSELTGPDVNLDFNADGVVDAIDYAIKVHNFGQLGASP